MTWKMLLFAVPIVKAHSGYEHSANCFTDFLSVRKKGTVRQKGTVRRPKQALIKSLVAGGGLVV
jgi:hypothetical protein